MMVSCKSYCQQTVTVKTDTANATSIHDLEVMFESQREAEKKIQESRIDYLKSRNHYLISAMGLEGILIIILISTVFVQKKKINRLRNN